MRDRGPAHPRVTPSPWTKTSRPHVDQVGDAHPASAVGEHRDVGHGADAAASPVGAVIAIASLNTPATATRFGSSRCSRRACHPGAGRDGPRSRRRSPRTSGEARRSVRRHHHSHRRPIPAPRAARHTTGHRRGGWSIPWTRRTRCSPLSSTPLHGAMGSTANACAPQVRAHSVAGLVERRLDTVHAGPGSGE